MTLGRKHNNVEHFTFWCPTIPTFCAWNEIVGRGSILFLQLALGWHKYSKRWTLPRERVIIKRLIQISLHSAICHKCVQFKWQMFPNVALPFQPPCITVWMRHFLCIDGFFIKAHPCTSKGFPAAALKHYLPVLLYLNLHFCASKAIQTGIRAGMVLSPLPLTISGTALSFWY